MSDPVQQNPVQPEHVQTVTVPEVLLPVPTKVKECCCNCCECCNFWGEEIIYGITFFGRLIITYYSMHALFFIYNFIVQFIILIPGILYITDIFFFKIIIIIVYLLFSILSSNIIVISTYDFLLFQFLRYRNVIAHLESLRIIINIINDKTDNFAKKTVELNASKWCLDIALFIIEISYIIGFFLGFTSGTIIGKDIIREVILIIIYIYYLVIFISYIIISINLIWKLFSNINKNENNCCKKCCSSFIKLFTEYNKNINNFFNEKTPLPKINLFVYAINPLLEKSYPKDQQNPQNNSCCKSCNCECLSQAINIIRFIVYIISFIIAIIILCSQAGFLSLLFCIIFFILMLILSLTINFPYILRNKNTFGNFFSPKNYYNEAYKMEHPKLVIFVRLLCSIIIFLVSIIIILSFLFFKDKSDLDKIKTITFSSQTTEKDENALLPNICFSSIYNMNINLYLPFINDAYYYDDSTNRGDIYSSLQIDGYKALFFDSNYAITVGNNLIPKKIGKDTVKMIQYDVTIDSKEITILSIKGTSNKKDAYIDLQLYFPSVLLNILSMFSIFAQQKDTYTFGFIEYGLSIPYRMFSNYLVIDEYLEDLLKAYYTNKSSFKNKVVIVGHSLGGGLAKILGRLLGKQAISLSGPGVNAFHSLWDYEGSCENFEISAIDLVPDMDLVPRVEVSGGTIYRIVCKEGPFDCHSKELSLCEVLIMCDNSNYKEYCKKVKGLNDKEINAILNSVQLNNKKTQI